ncbi:hypothetical protein J6590_010013 [Homalodisca vitripennis]|nr:hypothetical protein J6590_010013 [Homalodisca vitripennis]
MHEDLNPGVPHQQVQEWRFAVTTTIANRLEMVVEHRIKMDNTNIEIYLRRASLIWCRVPRKPKKTLKSYGLSANILEFKSALNLAFAASTIDAMFIGQRVLQLD